MQSAHRQSRSGGDLVLFVNANIEDPVRERPGESVQASRIGHRSGDRHYPLVNTAEP